MMKDYSDRQAGCGIQVGDKVKVIRRANHYENGWKNPWDVEMDKAIGNEYIVMRLDGYAGITLDFDLAFMFPYFVLSKVVDKPEINKCPSSNSDFEGYDTDYMDATLRESIQLLRDTLEYTKLNSQTPKPASGYTATLTFDLTTIDGAEAWHVHKQAYELHFFAFEVLHNLTRNFERELDNEMVQINKGKDSDPVHILRRLINELSENYTLNVN